MNSLTLALLLLVSCSVAKTDDANPHYHSHVDSRGSVRGLEIYRTDKETKPSLRDRRKRAISPFLRAWKSLLNTVYGSRRFTLDGKEIQLFAKIGTTEDALRDFISLNPKSVIQDAYGMRGQVGNQLIELRTMSRSGPQLPSLFVFSGKEASEISNKVTRAIF